MSMHHAEKESSHNLVAMIARINLKLDQKKTNLKQETSRLKQEFVSLQNQHVQLQNDHMQNVK